MQPLQDRQEWTGRNGQTGMDGQEWADRNGQTRGSRGSGSGGITEQH